MGRKGPRICWKTSALLVLALLGIGRLSLAKSLEGPGTPAVRARATPVSGRPVAPSKSGPATSATAPAVGDTSSDKGVRIQCDDDPDCGESVQSALHQSNAKQYEAALKTYQDVYDKWPTPWLLINLGRVQQKMGRLDDAVSSFELYLATAPADKPERIKVARAFLAQTKQEIEVQRYKHMLDEEKAKSKPIYKKWWFWTIIGGVVAGGVIAGAVAGTRSSLPPERMLSAYHLSFEF